MTKTELIKVLVKSQKTRRQITGELIRFINPKIEEINGYCALGALACEKKLFKQQIWIDGSPRDIAEPDYTDIIEAYGLENDLNESDVPSCSVCHVQIGSQISGIITHLNDAHKFTFEEIAKYLKTIKMKRLKKRND